MPLLRSGNLLPHFGLKRVLLVLLSFGIIMGIITFSSKFVFGPEKADQTKVAQKIFYLEANVSSVCPFSTNTYRIHFDRTVCSNKTLHFWYVPWINFGVWRDFRRINEDKKTKRAKDLEIVRNHKRVNATEFERDEENAEENLDTVANQKISDKPSKVVCTILAAFLVLSSVFAICEALRDICLAKTKALAKTSDKKLSLAETTLNDILKPKQEAQSLRQVAFPSTAKVTQSLFHQASLDRAYHNLSSKVKPPFLRRSSVPAQMLASNNSLLNDIYLFPQSQALPQGHFEQVDSCHNDNLDKRRKSRHFIRRH